jgi:putative DNA primase/helicase
MSFVDFARAHGLEINPLKAGEKINRCGTTNKPRSTNGAYYWDGQRGWVFAWDGEARVQWYDDPNAKPWTEEEKAAWRAKQAGQRARQEERYRQAAARAAEILRAAVPGQHDYLIRKRLPDAQGFVLESGELVRKLFVSDVSNLRLDGCLLVPMRNLFTNELQGLQIIAWDGVNRRWEKKMLPGMQAKGAVLRLGPARAAEFMFCEGFATGLSIEAAVRQMHLSVGVIVCFSANNMVYAASKLNRGRRYVFADHDDTTTPEREKRDRGLPHEPRGPGELAAIETGLPYCMSDVRGEDANDLHARAGLMALQSKLMEVRNRDP